MTTTSLNNLMWGDQFDNEDITYINDIRSSRDFRSVTFSNFKIGDVKKQLLTTIISGKPQDACYWTGELICAGHYDDLWDVILQYLGKYTHIGNPKLPIYLEMRYQAFHNIIKMDEYTNDLQARNSGKIRKLFAEIVCVLCFSNKKPAFEFIKINIENEFDINNIQDKIRAPSLNYLVGAFHSEDPDECIIATNEFAYSCTIRDTMTACYWMEWMIEFDTICKKRRDPCYANRRYNLQVETKFQTDVIWIFWDVIQKQASEIESPHNILIQRILKTLLQLFCIHYTSGCAKKRRYLLYFAVHILTENVDFNIEMISNKTMIERILQNIDNVYKVIKTNTKGVNMNYLYEGITTDL